MKMKLLAVHVAAALLGLALIVVALLVVLQWGNTCSFSLFGQNREPNTALVLLAALILGALLPKLLVWQFRWLQVIHRVRKEQADFNRRAMNLMMDQQSTSKKASDDSSQ